MVWNEHEAGAWLKGIVSINGRVEATYVDTGAAQAPGEAHRQRFGSSQCRLSIARALVQAAQHRMLANDPSGKNAPTGKNDPSEKMVS
jgi:hypothetical protein